LLRFTTHAFLFLSRQEIWFHSGGYVPDRFYNVYCAADTAPAEKNLLHVKEFKTTCIDLHQEAEAIFNSFHPTIRYEIRRAERENLSCKAHSNPSEIECSELIRCFDQFAKKKNIIPLSARRIHALRKMGCLFITGSYCGTVPVATHVYIVNDTRVALLYSFHNFEFKDNKMRGFANKFLHWKDILLFKEKGLALYDFGGIDADSLPGISDFKLGFGGETRSQYSYIKTAPVLNGFFKLYKYLHGNK
jgi:lipid II:glycine glycyltransferase (peptidoglycan interpeptide bridge formation enzyme)